MHVWVQYYARSWEAGDEVKREETGTKEKRTEYRKRRMERKRARKRERVREMGRRL